MGEARLFEKVRKVQSGELWRVGEARLFEKVKKSKVVSLRVWVRLGKVGFFEKVEKSKVVSLARVGEARVFERVEKSKKSKGVSLRVRVGFDFLTFWKISHPRDLDSTWLARLFEKVQKVQPSRVWLTRLFQKVQKVRPSPRNWARLFDFSTFSILDRPRLCLPVPIRH